MLAPGVNMHTQGQAIAFIERLFGPAKLTNGGLNANVHCPVCADPDPNKKKLAIRTDCWLTKCWVCGFKSKTIYPLIRRYKPEYGEEFLVTLNGASLVSEAEDNASRLDYGASISLPIGFQLLAEWFDQKTKGDVPLHIRQALRYLTTERKLSERDLWYFKLGVTSVDEDYKNRIIIPSHDQEGNLNFFTARGYKAFVKPKYFNPFFRRETAVFNEINIDWEDELTIVEGPFDMFKVNDNATCLLGKELTIQCALFQQIVKHNTKVLLCLDNDAIKQTLEIAKLLYSYGISVRVMELPEGLKDPGDLSSREEFQLLVETNTVEYNEMYSLRKKVDNTNAKNRLFV